MEWNKKWNKLKVRKNKENDVLAQQRVDGWLESIL